MNYEENRVHRFTSWLVALTAFSILTLGGFSHSEAAKKKAKHHETGEIKVKVVDASGSPVSGAKVKLRKVTHHKKKKKAPVTTVKAKHKHHHKSGRTAITDSSGEATFAKVKAGRYRLAAVTKTLGKGHAHASLKKGKNASVTIHLGAKGKHKARVSKKKKT